MLSSMFFQRGAEHVLVTFVDAAELATIDTLHVVVTGWQGTATTLAALPSPVPAAAVWRFEPAGTGWRWTRWRWAADDGYAATLSAAERIVNSAGLMRSSIYHIVRPADRWPTPAAQSTRTVPSPDGAWTAREVGGPLQPIDARDPASSQMFVGIEVEYAASGGRWLPVALWESGGIGSASTRVIGWRPNSAELVVSKQRCGDGCVLHCDHELSVFDGVSGTTRPLLGPRSAPEIDPTGRYVAGFAYEPGAAPKRAIVVADLEARSVISATFSAEEVAALAWAPDGSAVAFTVTDRYAMCGEHPASHLVRFHIATGALTDLTPVDALHRRVRRWNSNGTLEIDVFDGGAVWYDRPADAVELREAGSGALLAEALQTPTSGASTEP